MSVPALPRPCVFFFVNFDFLVKSAQFRLALALFFFLQELFHASLADLLDALAALVDLVAFALGFALVALARGDFLDDELRVESCEDAEVIGIFDWCVLIYELWVRAECLVQVSACATYC